MSASPTTFIPLPEALEIFVPGGSMVRPACDESKSNQEEQTGTSQQRSTSAGPESAGK